METNTEAQRGTTSGVSRQPPGSRLITLGHLITEGAAFCPYRNRHNGFRFAIMLLPKQPSWTCIMPFHHVLHTASLLIKELDSQQIKKVWQQVHAQGVIHPLWLSRHPPSPTLRTTLSHPRISWFWGFWTKTYSIGFPVLRPWAWTEYTTSCTRPPACRGQLVGLLSLRNHLSQLL